MLYTILIINTITLYYIILHYITLYNDPLKATFVYNNFS